MIDDQLRRRGIGSEAVLTAMAEVPRQRFVPDRFRHRAYEDRALPTARGQTISQPYIVALMTEAAEVGEDDHVLEVGTGSGYQAAVLAALGVRVTTIELDPELARDAARVRRQLGLGRWIQGVAGEAGAVLSTGARAVSGRGRARFAAILVTAATHSVPDWAWPYVDAGSRLVIPLGSRDEQSLLAIDRDHGGFLRERHLSECRFVPLRGRGGWRDPG